METKSILEQKLREVTQRIDKVDSNITICRREYNKSKDRIDFQLSEHISNLKKDADRKVQSNIEAIDKCVNDVMHDVDNSIDKMRDSFLNNSPLHDCNGLDISKLLDPLYALYPDEFIDKYQLFDPIIFKDSATLKAYYDKASDLCDSSASTLNTASLYKITTVMLSNLEPKQLLALVIAVTLLTVMYPWILVILLCASACAGIISGYNNSKLLHSVFSIKACLSNSYDTERFQQDKESLLMKSREYLESVADEYKADAADNKESIDEEAISRQFDEKLEQLKKSYDSKVASLQQEKSDLRNELTQIQNDLNELNAHNREVASKAVPLYLSGVSLGDSWLESIYLGNRDDDSIVMHPMHKTPTMFISENVDSLFQLAKLIIYQTMIRVNPDIVSQVFIDHKYVGGDLQSLFRVPAGRFPVAIKEEDIDARLDVIGADIFARVNNILSTCSGLDEFNSIMASYNSVGEAYVIVHVFGLNKLSEVYTNLLRNGSKVGYFLYLYLTLEELGALEYETLLTQFPNIYLVDEFPTAISSNQAGSLTPAT